MRSWCGVGAGVMAPVSPIGGDGLRHESSAADKEMPEELRRLAALSCLKDDTMPPPGLLAKLRHGVADPSVHGLRQSDSACRPGVRKVDFKGLFREHPFQVNHLDVSQRRHCLNRGI